MQGLSAFFCARSRASLARRGTFLVLCLGSPLVAASACGSDTPSDSEDGGRAGDGAAGAPEGGRDGTGGDAGDEATGGSSSGTAGTNTGGNSGTGATGGTDPGGSTGQGGDAGDGSGGTDVTGGTGGDAMGGGGMGGTGGSGGVGGAAGSGGASGCTAPCLVHRYSFTGSGTTVTDSVGTAHGTAVGCTLSAGGVTMAGAMSDQYVDLPDGILASLTDATFEAWVTWSGTGYWQRIFDFGSSTSGVGQGTEGATYLFLTPRTDNTMKARVAYSLAGETGETFLDAAAVLPSLTMTHVAVVVNDTANALSLYVNGAVTGTPATFGGQLSSIQTVNDWLGRSQFVADEEFNGTIHEFRIYGVARSASELQASYTAGPDSIPSQ